MKLHQYTDDCQIDVSVSPGDASAAATKLSACLMEVNCWMSASRLRLNPTKTQVMWLGSSQHIQKVSINDIFILSTHVRVTETARDLGVVIDRQMSLLTSPRFAGPAIINCGSFVQALVRCQRMPPKRWSMRLYHPA